MDQDLRGRFRRDFTLEQIGNPGQSPVRPAPITDLRPRPASPAATPTPVNQTPIQAQPAVPQPAAVAYEAAPITPQLDPVESPHRRSKSKNKAKRAIVLIVALLLIGGSGGLAFYQYSKGKQPTIPELVRSKTEIPVLYPAKLPVGYKVVQSSFNITSGNVVAYYAEDGFGHRLNFTVQPRPANFDFEKFYTQIISNSTRFSTPVGEGVVGRANGHLLGSLATSRSWAIVTGNNVGVGADKIQTALAGLELINQSN